MDKLKDITKKYGNFIELGAFVLLFISVFLPFVTVSLYGYSISGSIIKDTLGVFILIFAILGAGYVAIDSFAKDVFKGVREGNKNAGLILDLIPLGLAGLSLLFDIIKGAQTSTAYSYLNVGFYFILIATVVIILTRIIKCFFSKN